jgi:hypothetical protein
MAECSVCSKGVAEFVDDELDKGTFLDDISAKLATMGILIHRSSVHRHKKRHYLPRLRLRMLEKKARGFAGRLIVQWSDSEWPFPAAKPATLCFDDGDAPPHEVAADQIRDNDVLICVSFEPVRKPSKKAEAPKEETPTTATL